MSRYNVLIIGCGLIGAYFDDPSSEQILSHAHAYFKHNGFSKTVFVDLVFERAKQAAIIWGGKAYKDLNAAFDNEEINVVVISSPDQCHYENLVALSDKKINVIVVEKPLALTIEEARDVTKRFENSDCRVFINYSRRYIPEYFEIRNIIDKKELGDFIHGNAVYGKGLFHNGSHLLDFIRMLLGEILEVKVRKMINDYSLEDPSVEGTVIIGNEMININVVDSNMYTVFELDLFFSEGRIRILDSGRLVEVYNIVESDVYRGYKILNLKNRIIIDLEHSLYSLAENVYCCLEDKEYYACNLEDGFKVVELCGNALETAKKRS